VPPQPVFRPTPLPPEAPFAHGHGFGRGKPKDIDPGHPEAYWIWYDDNGEWHLRATTHHKLHHFNGRVWVSEGALTDVHPNRIEFNDRFRLVGDPIAPRAMEFDFHVQGGIDGVDFRVKDAKCVNFALFIDDHPEPGKIRVGDRGEHPNRRFFSLCP